MSETPSRSDVGDETIGALCVICHHRVIWHHDDRGCQFHGNGTHRCPCRRTSDQVVARIVFEAMSAAATPWLNASVTYERVAFPPAEVTA